MMAECEPDRLPSFTGYGLDDPARPLLISIPHSGRVYPPDLLARSRVSPSILQRLEDRYVDLLAKAAIDAGFPCIVAHRPRAWIDLNRSEREVDAAMIEGLNADEVDPPNAKVRGGLGLVPRWLGTAGELWTGRLDRSELDRRIAEDHRPYHRRIADVLRAMRRRLGCALLLDLHSMPSLRYPAGAAPRIVVGDRFGRSASSRLASLLVEQARQEGWEAALNHPYAGGYVLERHGNPAGHIQALQLEVDRGLYLDALAREPVTEAVNGMAQWLLRAVATLELELTEQSWPNAAE
ncbi:N-formylglutamate amidohydrolase [Novosphingopyxis sp. YJ-S2-01]|uniref:N-formylglutamate amidohydrolase n=1 Tax=Novosphingopyxis sp. YJ-S2-01 TaxID=2794021 RepID=UPI0018DC4D52|nr:N-formylglutamate amidohydrolase [Novosphingopyxis sp. YJ-S2-01]MBH9536222.1 N-formylglutamate amidohydrolase [Novosphingopyxis sp. YJ-S2-01]